MTPQQQIVQLPAGFTAEQTAALVAANVGNPLVLVQAPALAPVPGPGTAAPAPVAVPSHRDFWLGLLSVLKVAGDAALPIVLTPLLGGAAAHALDIGVDDAISIITGNPTVEHWTVEALRAKQAGVAEPKT